MSNDIREKIQSGLEYYQNCQLNGFKDVDTQIQLFSDDSIFISFSIAGVVGRKDIRILKGKNQIRNAFEEYNNFIKPFNTVSIRNRNMMIDPHFLRGGFAMEITTELHGEIKKYLNYLQMQFNDEMRVIQSLNWQAEVDNLEVFKLI